MKKSKEKGKKPRTKEGSATEGTPVDNDDQSVEREQALWFAGELESGSRLNMHVSEKVSRILSELAEGFIGLSAEDYRKNAALRIAARQGSMTDVQRREVAFLLREYAAALPRSNRGRPRTVDTKVAAATVALWNRGDRRRAQEIGGFSFDAISLAFFDYLKAGNRKRAWEIVEEQSSAAMTPSQSRVKRRAAKQMKGIAERIYDAAIFHEGPREWLQKELAGGRPVERDTIRKRAVAAGYGWRTVEDAASEIGVERQRSRPAQGEKATWRIREE